MAITGSLGGIIGFASANSTPVLIPIAFVIAMALMYLVKKEYKKDNIIEDEMIVDITQRAANISFKFTIILCAIIGAVFIAMRESYEYLYYSGLTLSYVAMAGLVMYVLLTIYYNKKGLVK